MAQSDPVGSDEEMGEFSTLTAHTKVGWLVGLLTLGWLTSCERPVDSNSTKVDLTKLSNSDRQKILANNPYEKLAEQEEQKEGLRAIELVKRSHALKYNHYLPPNTVLTHPGDPTKTDTEHSVANEMRRLKGDLHIHGWDVTKFDAQHYVVTFSWTINQRRLCYPFEVNTAIDIVRLIDGDPVLLKKYGFE